MKPVYGAIICLFWVQIGFTQSLSEAVKSTPKPPAEKKWFESFSIRGYVQARYNRLLETNPDLGNEQGDRSWGKGGGFFLRRMRYHIFWTDQQTGILLYSTRLCHFSLFYQSTLWSIKRCLL